MIKKTEGWVSGNGGNDDIVERSLPGLDMTSVPGIYLQIDQGSDRVILSPDAMKDLNSLLDRMINGIVDKDILAGIHGKHGIVMTGLDGYRATLVQCESKVVISGRTRMIELREALAKAMG